MDAKKTLGLGGILTILGTGLILMLENGPKTIATNVCGWTGLFCPADEPGAQPADASPGLASSPSAPLGTLAATARTSPITATLDPVLRTDTIGRAAYLVGLMKVRLTNRGPANAHVAWSDLGHASEVVLDNGGTLPAAHASAYKPKGVPDCGNSRPDRCWELYSQNFTVIPAGQTVTANAYYTAKLPGPVTPELAAVKTASLSAKLYVVVPDNKFQQLQAIDFKETPVQNTLR